MNPQQSLFIVGHSVRYLSQSASRGGYAVTGVDLFSDADTKIACRTVIDTVRQDAQGLVDACLGYEKATNMSWLFAAGFEAQPELLYQLNSRGVCLGNRPETLVFVSNPERFFQLLDMLGIRYPAVLFEQPPDPRGWLRKTAGSCGGVGVRFAGMKSPVSTEHYYQRRITGPVCSLTFLANGKNIEVLGINEIHAVDPSQGDFRFAGACTGFNPGVKPVQQMVEMARKLTVALRLRGANGIDCVIRGDQAVLLELNARPPATLELYERDLPKGGVTAHIAACHGVLDKPTRESGVRAYRILYSDRDRVVGRIRWPEWCSDRPPVGNQCKKGEPLCGVHANGRTRKEVDACLRDRYLKVRALFALSNQEAA
ncbi:MAG: ATP-grasp domain-containing protein [Sedimenticola sp.]|nr:ATP-grasp domain-containing protein [Sedimenticola sp.]